VALSQIRNDLCGVAETVLADERFVIVPIVIVNVYLPCDGTKDRHLTCEDILHAISSQCDLFLDCKINHNRC